MILFVFYDGINIFGGVVWVKKGDYIWFFLDKSRKVGVELGVGGDKNVNVRRDWVRVGVDDLMLVRRGVIIFYVSLFCKGYEIRLLIFNVSIMIFIFLL